MVGDTGSSSRTIIVSEGEWEGHRVMVHGDTFCTRHRLHVEDHYDDGIPTGFLGCSECLGWAVDPRAKDWSDGS